MKYIDILCVFAFNAYVLEDGLCNYQHTHLNIPPFSAQLSEQPKNNMNRNPISGKNEYNTSEESNFHPQNDILPCIVFPKYIDKK